MKKITLLFFMLFISFGAFAQLALEGFEGSFPPPGWNVYQNNVGPAAVWSQSQFGNPLQPPYAGDFAAYINKENVASGIPEDYLVTPAFTVPTNPELHFYSRLTIAGDDGSIYMVKIIPAASDATELTNYSLVQQWTEPEIAPNGLVYHEKVVDIPATYVGQSVRLAFVMAGDNGDRWLVDNVSVVQECIAPTTLGANNIGLTSANLTWANPGGATQFEIEVIPATDAPTGTGTIYNGDSPYTATPLIQATNYKFYVRAICSDGGASTWAGPFFFSTVSPGATCTAPLEVTSLPYSTTGNTAGFGDDYSGSPGASGCGSTSSYLNGDDVVYAYTATANGTINIAMTNNGAWSGMFVYTSCANIGVNCAAGGVGGSAGNPVTIPNFAVTAGQTYYIVISTWATPQTTPYTLTIQQVFCAPPVGNPATNVTTTSASLSWSNPSGATSWEVAVQTVGSGVPTGAGTTVTADTYEATGLIPSTQYEYYVRAACGDGNFSIWAGPYTFNTLCDAFGVPFTEGFNSTSPTQQCWTVLNLNGDTDAWNMDYATNPFEGNQSAMMYTDFNNGNNNDWLISPTINLTGNQRLKFHQRVQSAGEPNDFRVVASTTGIDPASFTITLMPLASYNNITYQEYIVNIVDATNTPITGPVNIAWHVPSGGLDGWRLYIDNVIIEDIPSCPDPTALTATNIGANSADLSWTPGFSETSWEVAVQAPGTGIPATGTAVTGGTASYTATGLTSNTQYEYYVRATCGVGDNSNWVGPFLFTTACDPLPIPFFEGFNSDSTTQNCWTVLNLNGDTDAWNMDYTVNPFEGNQSAMMYTDFNGGNNNDWLISPTLTLTGNQRLKFHQRVQSAGEPNDFEVLVSTAGTDPSNFTVTLMPLASYNNTTYVEYIVNIVDAANVPISGPVNIAWHVPNGGLDGWRLYIDNVIVEDIPTCPDPTALTAGNFTPNTADLSWTAGFTETSWEVVVQAPGTGEPTAAGTPVTGTPEYTATGLLANTQYEYYVRATCAVDDMSNWVGPFLFTTACDAFTVPFFEGFNSASTTQACWTVLNLNGDTDAWNMDYATNPFEGNQSAAITTDFNNGNNNDWLISPQIILTGNQRLKFHQRVQSVNEPDQFEVLLSTTGTNPADFTTTIVPLATYSNTTYQEYIINLFDGATPISGPVYIAWHIPAGGPDGWRLYVDNVIVEDIPTCPDPTALTVVDATDTTVDLTWTAGLNETQWEVIVQPQGTGEPAETATGEMADSNTFTVTGLTPGVQYEVYIRAVCAVDDLSNWVGPVNFNTDVCAPDEQCLYDFIMVDSFGDSWNGNTMSVIQNGITVATLTGPTNADDTNPVTQTVGLCSGIPFELYWNSGGSFAAEVGITVVNVAYAEEVYDKAPGSGSQNSLLYTGIAQCAPITCPQPTDLLSENGPNLESVQLSWTPGGTETQWEVVVQLVEDPYPGDTPATSVIVDGDPEYLAEGLTPSVFYEFYVRAICGEGDVSFWSGPYEFSIFAPPGCAGVDVLDGDLEVITPDTDIYICPGEETCFDLSANYFEIGETDEYTVESIDYSPPYPFLGGQQLNVTTDDIWSPVVDLPFDFCFYGETYDEAKVGSNGVVMFGDNMTDGGNCPWSYSTTIPNTGFPIKNAIYGVYQDINPAVAGSNVSINYQVLGNYPCRALVVNYYDVPQFQCGLSVGTQTSQIVIYEISNIIEVYVESRTPCPGWNGGRGVLGLQNADGTQAITPEGRNTGNWTATQEAWRFVPSGDTNVVFEWFQDGVFLSNDNDVTVCVTNQTDMTARATYTTCTGETLVRENNFTINAVDPIETNEPQDLSLCSTGEAVEFDLNDALEGMVDDPTGYNFTFYLTEEAANLGLEDNIDPLYTTDTNQTIWIRISIGDSPCYIVESFELTLSNVPPEFTATQDTIVCEGTPVTLEVFAGNFDLNDAAVEYTWTLDGNDLGLTTPSITVTTGGTYEVTVNNAGCVGAEEIVVTTITVPVADAPTDVTACDSYELPALTVGNYFSEPDGAGTAYVAGDVITTTTTLYVYAETGTAPNCTDENSFIVTINNTPVITTPGDQSVCDSYVLPALGAGLNYYTGAGATGTMLNAGSVIDATTMLYVYGETGTTPNCWAEETFTVTVTDSPVAQVMTDVTVCDSYELPALDAGNNYFTATNGGGDALSAGDVITSSQTIYIYAVSAENAACTGESSFIVTVNASPEFGLGGPYLTCVASNATVGVVPTNFNAGDATYSWTVNGNAVAETGSQIVGTEFGTYEVTVTVNGCTTTQSVMLNQDTTNVAVMYEEGCVDGGEYHVTALPFEGSFNPDTVSYAWSGPEGFSMTGQEVAVPTAGMYTVTVTTADGCVGTLEINVVDTSCSIPRGISPNGDGMNDNFDLTSLGVRKISIFNRYGREVFSYGAYTNQWHGQTNDGDELPTGTYFYSVERTNGESKTGWVYINRQQ